MQAIVDIHDVTKHYGDVRALTDVSFCVQPGVTGLLGPNGSGKSTLIKSLLGLVKTQSGSGQALGHAWPAKVRAIRDQVGYLPEDDCYIAGLVGVESVAFMARLSGLPGLEGLRRAHEIMDFCDIGEERYREVETYSTGMRQKLKFAQALVHDPPLLILDEPTTGLDPDQRESMLRRIKNLSQHHGKTVVLSTHILPDVRSVCDHLIILAEGTVRVRDTLETLTQLASPTMLVSIAGDSQPLAERCRREGHEVSEEPDGSLLIAGIGDDDLHKIWAWAAETGTSIRRYRRAKKSLDEVFIDAALPGSRAQQGPREQEGTH